MSYTCLITTPYGTLQKTVTISVKCKHNLLVNVSCVMIFFSVPKEPLVLSIAPLKQASIAGEDYTLECVASIKEGLLGIPQIMWLNTSDDTVLQAVGSTTAIENGTLKSRLEFSPLNPSHGGEYKCSAALKTNIGLVSETATITINVQCKHYCVRIAL